MLWINLDVTFFSARHWFNHWNRGISDLLILLTVEEFPDLHTSTADLFKCLSMWALEVLEVCVVSFQEYINWCKEYFLFASITGNSPLINISTKSVLSFLQVLRKSWNKYHRSLFHMKITTSVTKGWHEDRGLRYLHLQIFSNTCTLLLCLKIKKLFWLLFFSVN